jgi:hypothetical protein
MIGLRQNGHRLFCSCWLFLISIYLKEGHRLPHSLKYRLSNFILDMDLEAAEVNVGSSLVEEEGSSSNNKNQRKRAKTTINYLVLSVTRHRM